MEAGGPEGAAQTAQARPNHVWSWDFVMDRTDDGRAIRMMNLVDEYTRDCLAIPVARHVRARDVIDVQADVMQVRSVPEHLRSDNGPEMIAKVLRRWLTRLGAQSGYTSPERLHYLATWTELYSVSAQHFRPLSERLEPVVYEHGWAGIFEVEFAVQLRTAGFDFGIEISPACADAELIGQFPGNIRVKFQDRAVD